MANGRNPLDAIFGVFFFLIFKQNTFTISNRKAALALLPKHENFRNNYEFQLYSKYVFTLIAAAKGNGQFFGLLVFCFEIVIAIIFTH